ncbi:MAG: lytic transglycosylase domain-containing protein [Thermoanaerobaculia bacterium]
MATPRVEAQVSQQNSLPLISDRIRAEFLNPPVQPSRLTLEVVKEQFFRTHVPYGEIIYRQASRHGVPPELVAAVVHTESDFRPRLVSDKSAQGLMQIVPSTGRLLGLSNAFDPEQNISAGTRYLRYLLNRFSDQRLALAAYNAGEGNVMRFGGIPPFPETIGYVDKVHSRTRMYRQRVRSRYLANARISAH